MYIKPNICMMYTIWLICLHNCHFAISWSNRQTYFSRQALDTIPVLRHRVMCLAPTQDKQQPLVIISCMTKSVINVQ